MSPKSRRRKSTRTKPTSNIPQIETYYRRLAAKFGDDPRSDGYSNELAREARYAMYAKHFDFSGKTILDVGCGTGQFLSYLRCESGRNNHPKRYVGVDILPEKIDAAKKLLTNDGTLERCRLRGVEVDFVVGDIAKIDDLFQIVIACSIFDVKQCDVPTTFKIACATMGAMWARSTEGIGIDFFSPYALDIQPFNAPIPPEWVFTWAMQNLNDRVLLDYTYLPHDYSIIVRKGLNRFKDCWKKVGGWKRETGGEAD